MNRKPLLAGALMLACTLSAPFVIARDATPPPPSGQLTPMPTPSDQPMSPRMHRADRDHGRRGHRMEGHRMHGMAGPHSAAASDLRALEALYRHAGRTRELTSLYNDVLAKTQDPMLRTYVYHQLARIQMQPANVDQAAATLRKSLNENLAIEAKMRAEREARRQQWQQRRAGAESSDK